MKKLKQIIREYLAKGLSQKRIAVAIAVGLSLGIFPIYGPMSLLCIGLGWATGLNAPILLAGVYAMTFAKPLLILPFLKIGEWVFQADPMGVSLVELTRRFSMSPGGTLAEFAWSFVHAMVGWLVTLPLLLPFLYFTSLSLVHGIDPWRSGHSHERTVQQ